MVVKPWWLRSGRERTDRPYVLVARKRGPCCRHMPAYRQFEFVPVWNMPVYFHYTMRRVDCEICGVRVEQVPWAEGKSPVTKPFALFLARWAKMLSWQETASAYPHALTTPEHRQPQILFPGLPLAPRKKKKFPVDSFACWVYSLLQMIDILIY